MLQTLIQDYFQSCVRKMHVIASVYFANHQLVNVAKSPKTFSKMDTKGRTWCKSWVADRNPWRFRACELNVNNAIFDTQHNHHLHITVSRLKLLTHIHTHAKHTTAYTHSTHTQHTHSKHNV